VEFIFQDERFADVQMLRYRLNGFEKLSLRQKKLAYYLSEATLYGRDITYDQFCRYNLFVRKTLESIYTCRDICRGNCCIGMKEKEGEHAISISEKDWEREWNAFVIYLKRVWFSNGIHHHYGMEKFEPGFSPAFFHAALQCVPPDRLPLGEGQTLEELEGILWPVIFNSSVLNKRVNKADGADLLLTSACNFYQGVNQAEAEEFYAAQKKAMVDTAEPISFGLNSTLIKDENGYLVEDQWRVGGRYSKALEKIIYWLNKAAECADNEEQYKVINLLIRYYETGSLQCFNDYCKAWVAEKASPVDFINGFIEVYGDPLGLKGSWEGLVEYVDEEATQRTRLISDNAQWFEDHSPVDTRYKKYNVKGVSARVICAAMLGGEEYPSTAIGINLPNADWLRAEYGSKSITISNITEAYNCASRGSGMREEFVIDTATRQLIDQYADITDNLHTDLHECLGHGSGQLAPGTDPDALKAYGNTIEEARADLFGLYYIADEKLVELGLLPNLEAYKAQYYSYMMNGLMTQLVRITPGQQIEEAHMRNRALIARWCMENGDCLSLVRQNRKTYVHISDYEALRRLIARLLAEVQRIKSEGDLEAARQLVERFAVQIDPILHKEVLERYKKLHLAPYKGFINPQLQPVTDANGDIIDIKVDYGEAYDHQMLRYSAEYGTL